MSKSREQLNNLLKDIDITDKRVLDVGAGPPDKWAKNFVKGTTLRYKTLDIDKTFGCDYVFDLNEDEDYAIDNLGLYADTWGKHLTVPLEYYNEQCDDFDIVFCLETLEHCWNPVKAIGNLASFTKKGGIVYISTPFINPIHDKWDYMRYTFQWFEKVLPIYGFKDIKITPRVATEKNYDSERDFTEAKIYLQDFYEAEGMRMSKVTKQMGYDNHLLDIGYFVECRK